MKLKVQITAKDIEASTPHCGTECAAMPAIRRALRAELINPNLIDRVTRAYVVWAGKVRRRASRQLREFCTAFDSGKAKPLEIVVDVPDELIPALTT